MNVEVSVTDKRNYIYGLNMNFYGNKLKQNFPINSTRSQNSTIPSLLVGASFGKRINKINIQTEITFGVQNITERLGQNDRDWVQFKGWSPGILINYPMRLGKENTTYYYGSPSLLSHNLNFRFGIRYMSFTISESSGMMVEFGVGYRMTVEDVDNYKLKENL